MLALLQRDGPGQGGILQPAGRTAGSHTREPEASRKWAEPRGRRHRALEHGPVYLERAVAAIRQNGQTVSGETLAHLSPLKWEHINLTGDYHWRKDAGLRNRKLRPLRTNNLQPSVTP